MTIMARPEGNGPEKNGPEEETLKSRPAVIEPKQTCCQILNNAIKNITVEPATFLMLFSSALASLSSQTLAIEKTCRVNLNLSEAICDAVRYQNTDNNTENERLVQAYVANLLTWKSIITSVVPCFTLAFVGGWMDLTGRRKIIMMLPVVGEMLHNLSNILNVVFFDQLKVEYLIFMEASFSSIFGGSSVMYLAIFSYIADITTNENRTHRLGLVSFCMYVGMPLGMALSGIILKQFGYYAIYGTVLTLNTLNLLYITLRLKDPPRTKEMKEHDGRGFCYFLKTFFNPSHMSDAIRVVYKKTTDNRRLRLCILLGTACILFGPVFGESAILYLLARYRFNWDEVMFSIFKTYKYVTQMAGTMFSMLVFSKYLQWQDSVLGIISTISKILASFVYCFASNEIIFFIAPLVDILNGISILVIRSILSKSVASDELGKLNSIAGLTENLMPLLYVPLYTRVYTATMEVLPGAVFLMGAGITVPGVCVFIWLLYEHRKSLRKPIKPVNGMDDVELH